ncbi:MAG: filamentous hemagglutinin N-terminal domain-containing protein, partial [Spirulinaceae cyanobacterium]
MSPQKSIIFGSLCGILLTLPVSAQILPDTTLGAENTVVTPIDATRDRIDGGAIRDINLFHSFLEFNIDTNRSVYFSNPVGVENILTRVTGNNLSNIDGRLGVLGEANLFLLNPNGIIFGENATLDIRGSFIASTSDSIQLGDNGFFSATDIDNSQLLSVQPGALFSNALSHHQARIENQGQLQVGGNLTLDSDILTLQGQLHAGGNLTLNARDTVTLRDSTTQEFIASAGGEMLIQGNESVDIFILNHPDSGLYAVGDMTLRSANPVIGDAHYETGGNFRIETLDGSLGNFYSPNDPIVLARGDFSIYSYRGASLHVLAGGSINIPGGITITGPDAFNRSINPDYTPGLATVTTSDGETVTINGAAEPTIDLRAGIAWPAGNFTLGTGSFDGFAQPPDWAYSPTATSADINVGRLFFFTEGRVLLTNQYRPNPALRGNITIAPTWGAIATDTRGTNGGFVTIDSKGDVNVQGRIVADAIAPWGNGGEVKLLAAGDINLSGAGSAITTSGVVGGEITLRSQGDINLYGSNIQSHTTSADPNRTGGNIQIEGNSLWALNGARINTRSNNNANAGDIAINLQTFGYLGGNSAVMSEAAPGSRGNSGNLSFSGNFLWMDNADFRSMTEGAGNAGNLDLNINGTAWVENNSQIGSTALPGSTGNGGRVNLSTGNLFLINGSNINAATSGAGNGGEINLNVRDRATISGLNTGIINSVAQTSTGEGNTINLTANQLEISNGAIVTSLTQGQGNAGNINIDVTGATVIDGQSRVAGISSSVGSSGIGNGGQINLNTGTLDMFNTAIIESDTHNIGDTGDINVNVRGLAIIEGQNTRIRTNINPGAVGNGGQLNFSSNQLYLGDGAQIQADTNGQGHAGNIRLAIADIAYLDGQNTSLSSQSTGIGNSGQIDLTSDWLSVRNGARITTSTFGQGHAGNINITAYDTAIFENNSGASSSVLGDAVGNGGQINLTTNWLELRNQSSLLSLTNSQGNAGNLNINARDRVIIDNRSAIGSTVFLNGEGNSGQINLTTNSLEVNNTAQISTATYGRGNAGNLHLAIGNTVTLDNSGIITSSVLSGAVGNGGNIDLTAAWLFMDGGSDLVAETAGQGNAGNIDINVTHLAQLSSSLNQDITGISSAVLAGAVGNGGQLNLNVGALEVVGEAAVSTGTKGQGNAGTLNITARDRVLIDSNG